MIRYRIKTEQEFLDEYGYKWRNSDYKTREGYFFNPSMDYLLGTEINYNGVDYDMYIPHTGWQITKDMIKKIGINYNEKKVLVYD